MIPRRPGAKHLIAKFVATYQWACRCGRLVPPAGGRTKLLESPAVQQRAVCAERVLRPVVASSIP